MTVREAIDRIDSLKHNTYTTAEKVEWLSRLDGIIKIQIMGGKSFYSYTEKEDMDSDLLVSAPYDDIYIRWLEAQIDYYNGEISRYNNSNAMYLTAYDTYDRFYNRTHIRKGKTLKF
ncbi:MAG: hypothetical protein J6V25_10725 [Oscillospiraceae bacterium]|nr:hypothetical protein [Oscillospiraceae bacterium]